jgi:hypothetical protein
MDGLFCAIHLELYAGRAAAAWQRLGELSEALRGSLLLRVQVFRGFFYEMCAQVALSAAWDDKKAAPFVHAAERDARLLEREKTLWADALARLIRAGVAALRREAAAVPLYREAVLLLEAAGFRFRAAAARRRLGQLLGTNEGLALIDQANAWMTSQGIRNPVRLAATFAPGPPELGG